MGSLDGPLIGIAACVFILLCLYADGRGSRRQDDGQQVLGCEDAWLTSGRGGTGAPVVPAALIIVVVGVVLTCVCHPSVLRSLSLGPSKPVVRYV